MSSNLLNFLYFKRYVKMSLKNPKFFPIDIEKFSDFFFLVCKQERAGLRKTLFQIQVCFLSFNKRSWITYKWDLDGSSKICEIESQRYNRFYKIGTLYLSLYFSILLQFFPNSNMCLFLKCMISIKFSNMSHFLS